MHFSNDIKQSLHTCGIEDFSFLEAGSQTHFRFEVLKIVNAHGNRVVLEGLTELLGLSVQVSLATAEKIQEGARFWVSNALQ